MGGCKKEEDSCYKWRQNADVNNTNKEFASKCGLVECCPVEKLGVRSGVDIKDNSEIKLTHCIMATSSLKRPELKLTGNISENFKNFELRVHDYCIQADYRDLEKDPKTHPSDHYTKPQREIAALRSAMPDEALQVIRYTIIPQIQEADIAKPWVWMEKLRTHYTGTAGSSLMTDRFKFWSLSQSPHESVQDWEVKVRQAGSLCEYAANSDEMCRDKFVFGVHDSNIRQQLLKSHIKSDKSIKNMADVVNEAKSLETAQAANKLIVDSTKGIEEQVNWTKQ